MSFTPIIPGQHNNIVFEGVNFDRDMFAYVGYEFVIKKGYNPRDFVTLGANAGSVVSNMLSNMITVRNTGLRASKYEVTQEEWFALMGFNPSKNVSPKKPAENVDYFDCLLFIDVLNSFPETHSSGMRFMLPSYDEWIFACYGDADWQSRMGATVQEFESKGWLISNSGSSTHEVGLKEPNEVGLYDMIGNVREFTRDTTDLYYKSVCGGSFKTDGYWSLTTLDMASYEQSEDCGLRLFAEPKRDLGCGCQSAGARVGDY